ncbi:peptide ABC transporter substrate-binding protein [Lacticaseibacillus mingshuiensis]|uniref:peptide ABC transporter substrate-binding protein n=1 Tax=Lacticaseibacillus mingshuiensis TaxID=2799574 RepID=UPI001951DE87|nr:peptide ABC transporter substrate-binding protein [Lacticaseibacillus mingshuiensis]
MKNTKAIIAGTMVLAASTLFAACGSNSAKAADTTSTSTWTTMVGDGIQSMDPSVALDLVSGQVLTDTTETLLRYDGAVLKEGVATSVPTATNNGLTYTYHLRHSKWANGEAVTAKDFVYGWQRTVDPATKSQYNYLYSGIKNADAIMAGKKDPSTLGVKATDDYTLVVTLEHAIPYFNTMQANPVFAPQNQKFVEAQGSKYGHSASAYLSNGPYILKDWSGTGDSWTEVKNTNYWDAKDVHIKTLKTRVVKDSQTALNLYNTGKLDDAVLSGQQAAQAKTNKDYDPLKVSYIQYLQLNEKKVPAFKNTKIRQAISMAIDRQQFIKKVLNDGSMPASAVTPVGLFANPDKPSEDFATESTKTTKAVTTYNKKKAATLFAEGLKEVGESKLSITLLTSDTSADKSLGQYLQNALEQNLPGLTVAIQSVPDKAALTKSQNGDFDITVSGWFADFPDPINYLNLFTTGADGNNGSWSNAAYDKAVKLSETTDANNATKRYQDLLTAQTILNQDAGVIPLYQQVQSHLVNAKVSGLNYGANNMYNYVGAKVK